ncbi:MAG: hypothetical protein L0H59_17055 [Tomitella sp.]|nr:hypothetical protein [Tomitella sp.]
MGDNWDDRGLDESGTIDGPDTTGSDPAATFDALLSPDTTTGPGHEHEPPFSPPDYDELYRPDSDGATTEISPPEDAELFAPQPVAHDQVDEHDAPASWRNSDRRASRRRKWLAAGSAAAVVAVLGGGLAVMLHFAGGVGDDTTPLANMYPATSTAAPPPSTQAAPPPPAFCSGPGAEGATVTNGTGGHSSGIEAIVGMEHAYYATRNANEVVTFYAPALNMDPAGIQPFIDEVAPGAQHCVTINPTEKPDQYRVAVDLKFPNRSSLEPVDPLLITTTDSPTGWVLADVENAP